uniref:phosphoribosylamine--glycine ligase n=1 Tax=Candidatus Tripitaka californicus TaxID=3367616 RepID=UPI00402716E1
MLVIGSGGREHCLAWKIARSPRLKKLYCTPGNPGISSVADCVDIASEDVESLCNFARKEKIDLAVVGPEGPLVAGLVDRFQANGLRAFGPTKKAALLEGSKVFSKNLMRKYGIPTAEFRVFSELVPARRYIESINGPVVVKVDGLAGGKGAFVCKNTEGALKAVEEIMEERTFGPAGERVVVEEYLEGEEVSVLALTDGKTIVPLEPVQDHKALCDGDKGPNTGGMGAYTPVPLFNAELASRVEEEILVPTVHAMKREGRSYKGVLYVGLMVTTTGPRVLEYNVRFGDPETQPLLMRLDGDLLGLLLATVEDRLEEAEFSWDTRAALCVVMTSAGYPGNYEKGKEIKGFETLSGREDLMVFHAGTALKQKKVVTAGGRVLGVTALGKDLQEAQKKAYEAAGKISFDGAYYRKDIGWRALQKLGVRGQGVGSRK